MEEEKKKEKNFYKKWWFWVIIILVIFMSIGASSNNTNNVKSINANSDTNTMNYLQNLKKDYEDNVKVKTNPYETTNEHDGLYKFSLNSDNGSGNIFNSTGVILFDNGKCKIKYETGADSGKKTTRECDGFCGLNKEDNFTFYFVVNDEANYEIKTYKCNISEAEISCELKSEFDLSGCSNKELKLEKIETSIEIEEALTNVLKEEKERKEAEEKIKKEQEEKVFKESCNTYTFEQMARNPDNFKETNVKLTGEVIQVVEGLYSNSFRVNITKEGTYTTYYKDTIYVNYIPKEGEDKILEDDIVTIYGTAKGDYSYTSTMGATITLPFVDAKYITIEK